MYEETSILSLSFEFGDLGSWPEPDVDLLDEGMKKYVEKRCQAVRAVAQGERAAVVARCSGIDRKTIKKMFKRASQQAPDGRPWGFRACVPYKIYRRVDPEVAPKAPETQRPHSFQRLLAAFPQAQQLADSYRVPLPPGRPPASFDRLHQKFLALLKKLKHFSGYPFTTPDTGRRALLRYLRAQRRAEGTSEGPTEDPAVSSRGLGDLFSLRPFDRIEFDAHKIDINSFVEVLKPDGAPVRRKLGTMWLLLLVDSVSRAILSWLLVIGKAYTSLDVSRCLARALVPWKPFELTVPGLQYQHGAALPSGLPALTKRRGNLLALDNALAHHANALESGYCKHSRGIINFGRAHVPEGRPIIEATFSLLERGGLRSIAGGIEPSKTLGEGPTSMSGHRAIDYPLIVNAFEQLLDVVITGFNVTAHNGIGNWTPLQYLTEQCRVEDFFADFDDNPQSARELSTIYVPLTIHGKKNVTSPYVNYEKVKYRCSKWSKSWEQVGQKVFGKVDREDLRTIFVLSRTGKPLAKFTAVGPWNQAKHDLTTRRLINRWRRTGKLSLKGVECAVTAYHDFVRAAAHASQAALAEYVKLQQSHYVRPPAHAHAPSAPNIAPLGGWVNFDNARDG